MGAPRKGEKTLSAAATAPGPARRRMPMAQGAMGVAMAAMVSVMIASPHPAFYHIPPQKSTGFPAPPAGRARTPDPLANGRV